MTNTTSPASALETAMPGIPLFSIREQILIQISDAAEGQSGADIRLAVAAGLGLAVTAEVRALHPDIHGECHMCSDECGPKVQPCPTVRLCDQIDAAAAGGGE